MADRPITPYAHAAPVVSGHFDLGQSYGCYRPGGTPTYLMIYTCGGCGRVETAGQTTLLRAGDVCLYRPNVFQEYRTDPDAGRWDLRWLHFRADPDWLDLLDWPRDDTGLMRLHLADAEARREWVTRWRRVHHAALSDDPLRDRLALNATEALLLACHAHDPRREDRRADPVVRQAIEYVTSHLGEALSVDDLADRVGLSPSRFAHRFRAAVGVSPAAFVESCRLRRAADLLTTTALGVKEIAAQLGFSSQFYFSLRFKKQTGHSPTAYREGGL